MSNYSCDIDKGQARGEREATQILQGGAFQAKQQSGKIPGESTPDAEGSEEGVKLASDWSVRAA